MITIADSVLELEITPNRPDCLGVYGVAREVHAATGAPLAAPPWADDPGTSDAPPQAAIEIVVEAPDLCPRFTARVFENVSDRAVAAVAQGAPAPLPASGRSATSSTSPTT